MTIRWARRLKGSGEHIGLLCTEAYVIIKNQEGAFDERFLPQLQRFFCAWPAYRESVRNTWTSTRSASTASMTGRQ